ncbi:MAG: hypothetical protein KDD61_11685, partial [Bdellovibrionales bacterium]|nr:hypothetical protein [Bdellovibrionales bacterium]
IVVSPEVGSLREWPQSRWVELVQAAQAQILSSIKSSDCEAFLLSESSLFVWKDRITMITCGCTTLIKAAEKFISWVSSENIQACIYERKNEYHPHLQKSNVFEDFEDLQKLGDFECFRYGNADEHHLYIANMLKPYEPSQGDTTLELLMYDLAPEVQQVLGTPNQKIEKVREMISVEGVFPDFVVDDFLFEPYGYSLNALKGECYYTIHVTPQEEGSYVSFETNFPEKEDYAHLVQEVIKRFQPRTFDVVTFTETDLPMQDFEGFINLNTTTGSIQSGYGVTYSSFVKPHRNINKPFSIQSRELL